jgi:hypothetical protein
MCVHDGLLAYKYYMHFRHALCGVPLLRELTYFEKLTAETKAWAAPLKELLPEMRGKSSKSGERAGSGLPGGRLAALTASYERLIDDGQRARPPGIPEQVIKPGARPAVAAREKKGRSAALHDGLRRAVR